MKKTLAVASASAVALAAMPVLGVFAVGGESGQTLTDTITAIIDPSCSIRTTYTSGADTVDINARTFSATIAAGTYAEFTGNPTTGNQTVPNAATTAAVYCNTPTSNGYWTLSAAAGTTKNSAAAMTTGEAGAGTNYIPTGTGTSGTTSAWAFKVNMTVDNESPIEAGTALANNYSDWSVIPVSGGNELVAYGNVGTSEFTPVTFAPSYRVYVGNNQAPDTYTGTVVYTAAFTTTNPGA